MTQANVAQLFRALPCQGRGRELESLHSHHFLGSCTGCNAPTAGASFFKKL